MDVSNSTGQSTGYRVVGAGGTAPDHTKNKEGDIIEFKGKKLIKIKGGLWEVLAEGTLEPWTYVTVKKPKKPAIMVQFHWKGASCICDLAEATALRKAQTAELLIALTQNGQNGKATAETCVCRWKKA